MANISRWSGRRGPTAEDLAADARDESRRILERRRDAALRRLLDLVGVEAYLTWVDSSVSESDTAVQVEQKAQDEYDRVVELVQPCTKDIPGLKSCQKLTAILGVSEA